MTRGHGRLGGGKKKRVKKTSGMKMTEFEKEQRADAKRRAKKKKYKKIEPREGFKESRFGPSNVYENVSPKPPKRDPKLSDAQNKAIGKAWLKHKRAQMTVDLRRNAEWDQISKARREHGVAEVNLAGKKFHKKRGKK